MSFLVCIEFCHCFVYIKWFTACLNVFVFVCFTAKFYYYYLTPNHPIWWKLINNNGYYIKKRLPKISFCLNRMKKIQNIFFLLGQRKKNITAIRIILFGGLCLWLSSFWSNYHLLFFSFDSVQYWLWKLPNQTCVVILVIEDDEKWTKVIHNMTLFRKTFFLAKTFRKIFYFQKSFRRQIFSNKKKIN